MIPTIGLMVAALGVTVCLYIAARTLEVMAGDNTAAGVFAGVAFIAAILAMLVIGLLAVDLIVSGAALSDL